MWEDVWRDAQGPSRHLLQALIQLDAALIKSQQGRWDGALRLLDKALAHLAEVPDAARLTAQLSGYKHRVRDAALGRAAWNADQAPPL